MRCTTWWCAALAVSGLAACFGEQVVVTSNASSKNLTSSIKVATNQTSAICNDNSTRCKQWHADQKVKKRQLRETVAQYDLINAGIHKEQRVSIATPDQGPKPADRTEKTTARDVVLSLMLDFNWTKANEKAFKTALITDLSQALGLDNGTMKVSGIFLDAGNNQTKAIVSVKGDDNNAALDHLTSSASAKNVSFTSLSNASKTDKGPFLLGNISMTAPTSVLTPEALKINTANFKKELMKMPGYDKLPQLNGMDTTTKQLLERAAKVDDMDPSKDVQDGKSKHDRQITSIVNELLSLLGAEVSKKTKFNANAMQQLVLGKHSKGPEFKKRMAGLGKELANMLRPEL